MRRTVAILLASATLAAGCGSSGRGIDQATPPAPLNLTVYIDNSRVSLSPDSIGAGPLALIVTNQGSTDRTLTLLPALGAAGQPLASTGPIPPQGTAQLKVEIDTPGTYTLTTAVNAAGPGLGAVQPATLYVGSPRSSGPNDLLQP